MRPLYQVDFSMEIEVHKYRNISTIEKHKKENVRRMGERENGRTGEWENGRMGEWENGRRVVMYR
jgi:hypothetical protein